jgi:hypothetical protein
MSCTNPFIATPFSFWPAAALDGIGVIIGLSVRGTGRGDSREHANIASVSANADTPREAEVTNASLLPGHINLSTRPSESVLIFPTVGLLVISGLWWRASPHAEHATRLVHGSFASVSPMFSMQTLLAISGPSRNVCSGALGATAKPEWSNLVVCKMRGALLATSTVFVQPATYPAQLHHSFALEERPSLWCGRRIAAPALSLGTIR